MSGLHNTSWHNLPRQILFPYYLLNLLLYRYVIIKDMMYFTVNIPVHVFREKGVVCHIPQYFKYMIQIEVCFDYNLKTSDATKLFECNK